MAKQQVALILKKLSGKKDIFFTDRGNSAIELSLKLAKSLGKKRAIIQDQGGWITYAQYIKEQKLELVVMDTDYGIVKKKVLREVADKDSILLINSMPGYFALQENMDEIQDICKKKGCFLINDVSGSIGKKPAGYGDIVIGSFGRWKPINLEYGGFMAYEDATYTEFFEKKFKKELNDFYKELKVKLDKLPERMKRLAKDAKKVKKQLQFFELIHKDSYGYNVVVKTLTPEEKLKVTDFCKLYGYEYTQCPRYIRVMEDAISIEIKRKD